MICSNFLIEQNTNSEISYSPWSTIGSHGWIIDLSLLTGITLDTEKQTATIQAGVLTKQINEAVSKIGYCIQGAGASSVGYIPFMLGGGSTWMTGMHGLAVDNLISARVVTATKGLVVASESENSDLFWALKGAGQFFGLVTEVTTKIFPFEQKITTWTCIFLPSQIKEVSAVLETLANGDDVARFGKRSWRWRQMCVRHEIFLGVVTYFPGENSMVV